MAALGVDPVNTTAYDSDLRSRFLEEYPQASQRLEEAAKRLCIVELQTTFVPPDQERNVEVTYRANGPYALIRVKQQMGDGTEELVTMAHPKRTFRLDRTAGRDEFMPTRLAGAEDYAHSSEVIRMYTSIPFVSFCYLEARIVDIMKVPEFTLGDVAELEHEGRRAVKASFTWSFERDGTRRVRPGYFIFCPEESWALQEYKLGPLRGAVRYGQRVDGVPVAEEFETWRERDGQRAPTELKVKAIKTELKPAGLEEFTLRAFGLPDLDAPASKNYASRAAYWFLGLACLAGIIAIVLRRYAYRTQN